MMEWINPSPATTTQRPSPETISQLSLLWVLDWLVLTSRLTWHRDLMTWDLLYSAVEGRGGEGGGGLTWGVQVSVRSKLPAEIQSRVGPPPHRGWMAGGETVKIINVQAGSFTLRNNNRCWKTKKVHLQLNSVMQCRAHWHWNAAAVTKIRNRNIIQTQTERFNEFIFADSFLVINILVTNLQQQQH